MARSTTFEFAVILINYNTEEDILSLISKLKSFREKIFILVYDNKPDKAFAQTLSTLSEDDIHYFPDDQNSGYCAAVNFCFARLKEMSPTIPYTVLMNSDIEFQEDTLYACRDFLATHPSFIAVNPLIYDGSGQVWYGGGFFDRRHLALRPSLPKGISTDDCDSYNGCFVVFTDQILDFTLDNSLFMYYDEFDVSQRILQKGYKIKMDSDVSIIHHVSKSLSGREYLKVYYQTRNRLYVLKKHRHQVLLPVYTGFLRTGLSYLRRGQYKTVRYLLKGILDYRTGKMGKLID